MTLLLLVEPLELCTLNYGYTVATSRDRSGAAEPSPSVWHWSINIQTNRLNSVTLSSFTHVKNSRWDVCWRAPDEITPFFTLHLFQFKNSPKHHHILIWWFNVWIYFQRDHFCQFCTLVWSSLVFIILLFSCWCHFVFPFVVNINSLFSLAKRMNWNWGFELFKVCKKQHFWHLRKTRN